MITATGHSVVISRESLAQRDGQGLVVLVRNANIATRARSRPMTHPAQGDHADRVMDSMLVFQALNSLSPQHRTVLQDVYIPTASRAPRSCPQSHIRRVARSIMAW
ncbi:hypothetical protein GCM10009610_71440 [Pseudonocardia xinjiangensis]